MTFELLGIMSNTICFFAGGFVALLVFKPKTIPKDKIEVIKNNLRINLALALSYQFCVGSYRTFKWDSVNRIGPIPSLSKDEIEIVKQEAYKTKDVYYAAVDTMLSQHQEFVKTVLNTGNKR